MSSRPTNLRSKLGNKPEQSGVVVPRAVAANTSFYRNSNGGRFVSPNDRDSVDTTKFRDQMASV
jgi:hypothetical protein